MVIDYVKMSYGWRNVWSESIWPYLFYLYYSLFFAIGFYLLLSFGRRTENPIKKRQAKILFVTIIISVFLGSLTNVLLPRLNIYTTIPEVANVTSLIWISGMVYAIAKYKFLIITPAMAADNIISTMSDSLILLDPKGNTVTANKAVLKLTGYQEDELEGEPARILFAEENILLDKIIKGEPFKNYELALKTKTGKNIPVLFSTSVLQDQIGNMAGIVCVARDITERKEMEEKILSLERIAVIGKLSGGIAHEIRNTLAVISSAVYYLKMKITGADEKTYTYLDRIKTQVDEATATIQNLQNLTMMRELSKIRIDLSQAIETALDRAEVPPEIKVVKEIPSDEYPIDGSLEQLAMVFKNLATNAVQAMNGQGTLWVKVGKTSDRWIEVSFKDTGCGIAPDDLKKVFQPLFSTKLKGMGFGLTICQMIIEKHGGRISVESEPEKGATFIVKLPEAKTKHGDTENTEKD